MSTAWWIAAIAWIAAFVMWVAALFLMRAAQRQRDLALAAWRRAAEERTRLEAERLLGRR